MRRSILNTAIEYDTVWVWMVVELLYQQGENKTEWKQVFLQELPLFYYKTKVVPKWILADHQRAVQILCPTRLGSTSQLAPQEGTVLCTTPVKN